MDGPPNLVRFSIRDVPECEREVALHEILGRAVMNMDVKPLTDDWRNELELQFLPGAVISRGLNSPQITYGGDMSRESDDLMLIWGTSGGLISQRGMEIQSDRGPALFTCGEFARAENRHIIKFKALRLQRSLLLSVLPQAETLMMQKRVISPDNEAFRLLDAYLSSLRDVPPSDADVSYAAALHICDLIALAFGANGECGDMASSRGLRAARLDELKRWVMAHLTQPSLTIATAAAAQRLSPRYVQILFAEAGPTFSEFVLSNRLRLVRRQLRHPRLGRRPISSIAYEAGFNDLSYFNRAFKAAYGETPSDVRARAAANHSL